MSHAITREQLIGNLNWRYATKQFDPARKISPQDWAALEESIILTPSSFGLQPIAAVVVNDSAVKEKLVAASYNQRQVADASHLVVFSIKTNVTEADVNAFIKLISEKRGVPAEALEGYRGMMIGSIIKGMDDAARRTWAAKQAYIALGQLMASAAMLNIDVCPIEGFSPAAYDATLNLAHKGLSATVVAAIGYRAQTDGYAKLPKVRLPKEQIIVHL
jgi:nitroreductase